MGVVQMAKRAIGATDDVAALEAEIASVKAKASAACIEKERLEAEKLEVDDWNAAQRIVKQIEQQDWIVSRADRVLPELEARLARAKAGKQAEALARHVAKRRAMYSKLKAAVQAAAAIQNEAIDADEEACRELGEHVARAHLQPIAFRGILLPDLVAIWAAEMDRVFAAPAPKIAAPQRSVKAPVRAPKPSRPAGSLQHSVRIDGATGNERVAPNPPRQARATVKAPAPQDGELRCIVLRTKYEADGKQFTVGDELNLPANIAMAAAQKGAVDIVQESKK